MLTLYCRTGPKLNSEHQIVGSCWSPWWWHISSRLFHLQQQCTSWCDLSACAENQFQWSHCKCKEKYFISVAASTEIDTLVVHSIIIITPKWSTVETMLQTEKAMKSSRVLN